MLIKDEHGMVGEKERKINSVTKAVKDYKFYIASESSS